MSLPDQRPILLVGFSIAWLNYIGAPQSEAHALVIEEPDVARKRDAQTRLAARGLNRLILSEYQLPGAARRFHAAYAHLRPAAVLPCVEYAVPFAARLAELYGVAGAGSRAAAILRTPTARVRDAALSRDNAPRARSDNPLRRPALAARSQPHAPACPSCR